MKAIYTTARGNVFRINQNPMPPEVLADRHVGAHAKVEEDSRARVAKEVFCISTLDVPNTLSNREMYVNLCKYLKEHKVTHIDIIQNRFKVLVEYTSTHDGVSGGVSTVTKDVPVVDCLIPLGTATNNENVFRRGKMFKQTLEFIINDSLPYGITDVGRHKFCMRVNNISIFQDFNPIDSPPHQSAYCTPYGYNNMTTYDNLQNMQLVYSSQAAGIRFDPIELNFIPRKVAFGIDIMLSNYIDVYDSSEIDKIIDDNIHCKYQHDTPVVPDDPTYPAHMINMPDTHPWADGDNYPRGRDKTYEYYRRTNQTHPSALLVVENEMGDDIFDAYTMIHQKKVIRDIPDIQVGEYVRLESGFLITNKRPPRPPHPPIPPHPPYPPYPPYPPHPYYGEGNDAGDGNGDTGDLGDGNDGYGFGSDVDPDDTGDYGF